MATKQEVYSEIEQRFGQVPTWTKTIPEPALIGFWALMRDLELGETTIPGKYKELIGLAVAGATRCRYCALFHTEGARLNGATDQEIAEASMMAALTMAGSTFLNAEQTDYELFRKETLESVDYVKQQLAKSPSVPSSAQREQVVHA